MSWVSGVLFPEVGLTPVLLMWKLRHRMTSLNPNDVTRVGADLGFESEGVSFLLGKLSL